jgi:flavin-dependent dehydrogenase
MKQQQVDVLVIGAGPAGTVAASIINKAGFKVSIVEKEQFPRFVIGESLLPKCMEALEAAGFLPALEKQGFQKKTGAKFINNQNQIMDFDFSNQFTKGWSWTWQVPRADFDLVLANEAERMGVTINYQTTVVGIDFFSDYSITKVVDKEGNGSEIKARFIVDGSGWGRVIPKLFEKDKPSGIKARKTLFTHLKDPRRKEYAEPDRIWILDHDKEVWAWCIPFSNGNTSCGFVAESGFFDQFEGTDEDKLRAIIDSNAIIKERFKDSEFLFEPRTIQGWSSTTDKFYGNGYVLTGNVTEFLDPVFSSGVTLAVTSSRMAAELAIKQLQGESVDWEKEYMDVMMQGIDVFRTYVLAWYDGSLQTIFYADQTDPTVTSQICSVLAGYVWDTSNPYVAEHDKNVKRLVHLIDVNKRIAALG